MYISAKKSKEIFNVWGSFYTAGKQSYRNALDMATKDILPEDLTRRSTDAIIIMLNPGSSEPLNPKMIQRKRGIRFTLTKPDQAQYQIMSLMHHMNWNHVRVLNLSDLREPRSKDFLTKLKNGKLAQNHSIFCTQREQEFKELYQLKKSGSTVLAWTFNLEITDLAKLALKKNLIGPCGIQHLDLNYLYRYPSPPNFHKKREWLQNIIKQIKEKL